MTLIKLFYVKISNEDHELLIQYIHSSQNIPGQFIFRSMLSKVGCFEKKCSVEINNMIFDMVQLHLQDSW